MCNLTKVLELQPPSPLVLQLSPAPLTPAVPRLCPVCLWRKDAIYCTSHQPLGNLGWMILPLGDTLRFGLADETPQNSKD